MTARPFSISSKDGGDSPRRQRAALPLSRRQRRGRYRVWLEGLVNGDEAYGMSPQVLCSVARIATHARVYVSPSRLDDVLAFARVPLEQPQCTVVTPGPRHFLTFEDLCRTAGSPAISSRMRGSRLSQWSLERVDYDGRRLRSLPWPALAPAVLIVPLVLPSRPVTCLAARD